MPRSSFFSSAISSRSRAATSNCSSRAAREHLVVELLDQVGQLGARHLGDVEPAAGVRADADDTGDTPRPPRPGTGDLPRDCDRPEPPTGVAPSSSSVSSASRASMSVMSAIRLRSGCGSMPCSLVVGDLLLAAPVRLVDRVSPSTA